MALALMWFASSERCLRGGFRPARAIDMIPTSRKTPEIDGFAAMLFGNFHSFGTVNASTMFAVVRIAVLSIGVVAVTAVANAAPATVLWASFETQESQNWTVQRPQASRADILYYQGSNLDGVAGERFLLCGIGTNPGKIRFSVSTVAGRSYALSYCYGGTDTQRLPIGSGPGFQLVFKSSVQAFKGKKTIIDHRGIPVEIDDLENLSSQTHAVSTPGLWNWRIHAWSSIGYSFVAKSEMTWIEFETVSTNGMASVGVLDQVLVTTGPFATISMADGNVRIDFAGRLQESGNLTNWNNVSPSLSSPLVFPKGNQPRFFRVEK